MSRYEDPAVAGGPNQTNQKKSKQLASYGSDMAFVRDVYGSYVDGEDSVPSYNIIRQVAEELGDTETVLVCNMLLRDEKKIEDWRLAVSVLTKET